MVCQPGVLLSDEKCFKETLRCLFIILNSDLETEIFICYRAEKLGKLNDLLSLAAMKCGQYCNLLCVSVCVLGLCYLLRTFSGTFTYLRTNNPFDASDAR